MKSVLTLARLEYSRHEAWALFSAKRDHKPYRALSAIGTVALGIMLFDGLLIKRLGPAQEWISLWGVACIFLVMVFHWSITLAIGQTLERDWWLSFPHPRLHLMLGKSLATAAISARIGAMLAIGFAVAHTVLAVLYRASIGVSPGQLVYGLLVGLSVVILLPFAIGFSSLAVATAKGWLRILVVLQFFVIWAMLFIPASSAATGAFGGLSRLSSTAALLRALPWFFLGWPFAAVCLALTPWGLARLGDARFPNAVSPGYRDDAVLSNRKGRSEVSEKALGAADRALRAGARRGIRLQQEWQSDRQSEWPQRPRRPYAALFRMELTRYRALSRSANRFTSAAAYTWLFLMVVSGFFVELSSISMFLGPMFVSWFLMFGLYTASMNVRNLDRARGYLPWLLSFPLARWKLLVVEKLAALCVMILSILLSLAACAAGFLIHALFTPVPGQAAQSLMLLGQAESALLVTGALGLGLSSCFAWLLAHPWRTLLLLPLVYAPMAVFFFMNNLFFSGSSGNSLPATLTGYGPALAWIVGVGLPLAVWGVWIGARHQHVYMQVAASNLHFQSAR
ncbi:MAG: hypothetical protein ACYCVB_18975 [Bacilli bacterium]